MARERCSLVFTASSEIPRHSAVSMVLSCSNRFPVAAANGLFDVPSSPEDDRVTPKLAALQVYQLAIPAPKQSSNPFNFSARRGQALFDGKARCGQCHVPPLFTEPGWNAHTLRKFVPTAFKRTARRTVFIAPRRSPDCFPIRREASTTTADSPRCPTS